ncbi:amidohydrolase family protein [Floccifex sp.]|uniref:amidohydrolase family protein n=1 Tax=Floccifex sp. TaxID=2815810 RepID=UPI003F0FDCDE
MKITFAHCNILNGNENMKLQKNMNIIVDKEKIVAIEKDIIEGTIIDCSNQFVCPGLINMHVHLSSDGFYNHKNNDSRIAALVNSNPIGRYLGLRICQSFAYTELMSGVTTIRCVGGLSDVDSQIRDKIKEGKLIGPRMLVANRALTMVNGYMHNQGPIEIHKLEDCKEALEKLIHTKPDFIKIMVTGWAGNENFNEMEMPAELIRYITNVSHQHNLPVAAHVQTPHGIQVALENGVDIIEHGSFVDEKLLTLYMRKGAKLISILSGILPYACFDTTTTYISDESKIQYQKILEGIVDNAKKAIAYEIPLGIGNDAGRPFVSHYDFYRELIAFKKLMNVSNEYVLFNATKRNAQLLNIENITGTIEVGKYADFIIMNENPAQDLNALSHIDTVVFNGRVFKNPKIKKNRLSETIWNLYKEK